MTAIWLPFILLLVSLGGICGTLLLVVRLRDKRRESIQMVRTAWALELLEDYNRNEIGTELQRWGVTEAIRHGLMPPRLTSRRWECTGQDLQQLFVQLQAWHTLHEGQRRPKRQFSFASIPNLRRSHA